jgi:CRISPR-associated Cas5-like protein
VLELFVLLNNYRACCFVRYDYSGEFAFTVGFPSKSGVSGVLCIVIPGVVGISTFSPRLDHLGNSVRGLDFCKALNKRFPFHQFSVIHIFPVRFITHSTIVVETTWNE